MATTQQWCDKLKELDGLKFAHQGRSREAGVDCYGLFILAAKELSFSTNEMFSIRDYRRLPGKGVMEQHIGKFLQKRPYNRLQQAQLGDILQFTIDDRKATRHLGAITTIQDGLHYMIHADGKLKRVIETRITATVWAKRLSAIWYVPQLEDTP